MLLAASTSQTQQHEQNVDEEEPLEVKVLEILEEESAKQDEEVNKHDRLLTPAKNHDLIDGGKRRKIVQLHRK